MKGKDNMAGRALTIIALAAVAAFLFSMCFFMVDETEYAVVSQFGNPIWTIEEPGLYMKMPDPVHVVSRFDHRLLVAESTESEILTADKKNLVIDYYVVWRISDPLKFMQTVFDEQGARFRIGDIVYSEIRSQLGLHEISRIISVKRDSIHAEVTATSREKLSKYGIEVLDVRIRRLNFPDQNKYHVYERMRSERSRMANKYRSEGEEEAMTIRAEADRLASQILSEAARNATMIMGASDAEAAVIYGQAYESDPEFYSFVRSMQAYGKIFSQGDKTLILSRDEPPLDRL